MTEQVLRAHILIWFAGLILKLSLVFDVSCACIKNICDYNLLSVTLYLRSKVVGNALKQILLKNIRSC